MNIFRKIFGNPTVYGFELNAAKGGKINLSDFKGKKILFVNTASACGLTPQFADLEKFHKLFKDKVVVIGLPCNDFAGQEPLKEQEICDFASTKYGVTFPLSSKLNIKTPPIHQLYDFLTKKSSNGVMDSEVAWNFQKYLCDEKGRLIRYFPPDMSVFDEEVIKYI